MTSNSRGPDKVPRATGIVLPMPYMWASNVSSTRPGSRNTGGASGFGSPHPPPTAAFGSRPAARQRPTALALDLFDQTATPASSEGRRKLLRPDTTASDGRLSKTVDGTSIPHGHRTSAEPRHELHIPIIVEDSWGDLSLPPLLSTVSWSSSRRSKGSQR